MWKSVDAAEDKCQITYDLYTIVLKYIFIHKNVKEPFSICSQYLSTNFQQFYNIFFD